MAVESILMPGAPRLDGGGIVPRAVPETISVVSCRRHHVDRVTGVFCADAGFELDAVRPDIDK